MVRQFVHSFYRLWICGILILVSGCGSNQYAMQPASDDVEVVVTGATAQDTVTEEVVQSVAFDQCQSGSPFKANMKFSQSSGQEQQDKVVVTLGAGAEVGLSEVAKAKVQGTLERHLATIESTSAGREESVEIEVPAHTQQQYTITWRVTKRTGQMKYTAGGTAGVADYSYRIGVQLVSAAGRDLPCPGQKATTPATSTTPADTPAMATMAPPAPTPSPSPIPPSPAPTADPRLFWDDFSNLPKAEWGMEGTGWSVVKNKFVADNASAAGYIGNQTWQDYAVVLRGLSIELSSTNFPSRYLEVPVRMTDRSNYIALRAYIAWAWNNSSAFGWVKVVNGTEQAIPGAGGGFRAWDSPATLRIEVRGNKFTTIVNGSELMSFFDDSFQKGGCGLRLVSFPMSLDAYEVVKLSP